jgi:hypothetical protein
MRHPVPLESPMKINNLRRWGNSRGWASHDYRRHTQTLAAARRTIKTSNR